MLTPRTERQEFVSWSDKSTDRVGLYRPLLDRGKLHARYVKEEDQVPGQLSPAGESNKNAAPNDPNGVGQKVRQELC